MNAKRFGIRMGATIGFGCLLVMLALLLPSKPAAQQSLQDMIRSEQSQGRGQVTRLVNAVTSEYKVVGFKIGGDQYAHDFNSDGWRTQCHGYQGMGWLDGKYLDFVYGGDDVIVFCFTSPKVKNGGTLRISALIAADPGDVEVSTSATPSDFVRIGEIRQLGMLELEIPPSSGSELYLMLDGRQGNGVVVDDFSVVFKDQGPTPTPTPTPEVKKSTQGGAEEKLPEGQTRGSRVEPTGDPEHTRKAEGTRSGLKKANER